MVRKEYMLQKGLESLCQEDVQAINEVLNNIVEELAYLLKQEEHLSNVGTAHNGVCSPKHELYNALEKKSQTTHFCKKSDRTSENDQFDVFDSKITQQEKPLCLNKTGAQYTVNKRTHYFKLIPKKIVREERQNVQRENSLSKTESLSGLNAVSVAGQSNKYLSCSTFLENNSINIREQYDSSTDSKEEFYDNKIPLSVPKNQIPRKCGESVHVKEISCTGSNTLKKCISIDPTSPPSSDLEDARGSRICQEFIGSSSPFRKLSENNSPKTRMGTFNFGYEHFDTQSTDVTREKSVLISSSSPKFNQSVEDENDHRQLENCKVTWCNNSNFQSRPAEVSDETSDSESLVKFRTTNCVSNASLNPSNSEAVLSPLKNQKLNSASISSFENRKYCMPNCTTRFISANEDPGCSAVKDDVSGNNGKKFRSFRDAIKLLLTSTGSLKSMRSQNIIGDGKSLESNVSQNITGDGKSLESNASQNIIGDGKSLERNASQNIIGDGKSLESNVSKNIIGDGKSLESNASQNITGDGNSLESNASQNITGDGESNDMSNNIAPIVKLSGNMSGCHESNNNFNCLNPLSPLNQEGPASTSLNKSESSSLVSTVERRKRLFPQLIISSDSEESDSICHESNNNLNCPNQLSPLNQDLAASASLNKSVSMSPDSIAERRKHPVPKLIISSDSEESDSMCRESNNNLNCLNPLSPLNQDLAASASQNKSSSLSPDSTCIAERRKRPFQLIISSDSEESDSMCNESKNNFNCPNRLSPLNQEGPASTSLNKSESSSPVSAVERRKRLFPQLIISSDSEESDSMCRESNNNFICPNRLSPLNQEGPASTSLNKSESSSLVSTVERRKRLFPQLIISSDSEESDSMCNESNNNFICPNRLSPLSQDLAASASLNKSASLSPDSIAERRKRPFPQLIISSDSEESDSGLIDPEQCSVRSVPKKSCQMRIVPYYDPDVGVIINAQFKHDYLHDKLSERRKKVRPKHCLNVTKSLQNDSCTTSNQNRTKRIYRKNLNGLSNKGREDLNISENDKVQIELPHWPIKNKMTDTRNETEQKLPGLGQEVLFDLTGTYSESRTKKIQTKAIEVPIKNESHHDILLQDLPSTGSMPCNVSLSMSQQKNEKCSPLIVDQNNTFSDVTQGDLLYISSTEHEFIKPQNNYTNKMTQTVIESMEESSEEENPLCFFMSFRRPLESGSERQRNAGNRNITEKDRQSKQVSSN